MQHINLSTMDRPNLQSCQLWRIGKQTVGEVLELVAIQPAVKQGQSKQPSILTYTHKAHY